MRRSLLSGAVLVVAVTAGPIRPAMAGGVGGQLTFGTGNGEWTGYVRDALGHRADADTTLIGGALLWDTGPARDRLFRYRLGFGYLHSKFSIDESGISGPGVGKTIKYIDADGFVTDHTFAFAFVRSGRHQVWIGPQFRFGAYSGDLSERVSVYSTSGFMASKEETHHFMGEAGAGAALGWNLNIGRMMTFGLSTQALYSGYAGLLDVNNTRHDNFRGKGWAFSLNLDLLLRTGEDVTG